MSAATASPRQSAITAASNRFVADHLAAATALGERLAETVQDPDAFVAAIAQGFEGLGDPVYAAGSQSIAPGLGPIFGVRLPLMEAAHKTFKRGTRKTSTSLLLDAIARLLREEKREIRWFGIWNLSRLLPTDPERTWQLLRAAAREADEWITVDTLAHPYGEGILLDTRRWVELDQLVYSPSRWERRLVGSTLATIPHANRTEGPDAQIVMHGLTLLEQLIGDSEPDVQKALSWALRTYAQLDPTATTAFLQAETQAASENRDGNRTWVIRDSLSKLPEPVAANLRASLEGIRRAPKSQSTSRAAATAAQFATGAAPRPASNPWEG